MVFTGQAAVRAIHGDEMALPVGIVRYRFRIGPDGGWRLRNCAASILCRIVHRGRFSQDKECRFQADGRRGLGVGHEVAQNLEGEVDQLAEFQAAGRGAGIGLSKHGNHVLVSL